VRIAMDGRANQYLEDAMRWIHTIIIILFVTATFLFAAQNLQIVTLSFLGFSARVPVALLVVIVYLLGTMTGDSLLALLRQSIAKSRFRIPARP
jgi:lipopolysaccharide assembly protein A